MKNALVSGVRLTVAALLVVYTGLSARISAQPMEQKIVGDIVSVQADRMELKALDGRMLALRLPDDVRLSARAPADPSLLKEGAFVGTTAVPRADGTLVAREVHIFPESMRGRGEGHRSMDGEPGSTMTNATVSRVGRNPRSTMTNATVAEVATANGGHTLTLAYKGGEKTVLVPEKTPIVMVETGERSQLLPGAHVVVYAATGPDGTLAATRITVGLKGLLPPS
jgi:hypothetical protein